MMRSITFVLISCLWYPFALLAQHGLPFTQSFPPTAYASDHYVSSPQNWGIIQDNNGMIFVGNTSGVLVFDGLEWEQVLGTEDMKGFKFAKDGNGIVYTGGLNDLGYIAPDPAGRFRFHSLKNNLLDSAQHFNRVVNVVASENQVYFMDRNFLMIWDGTSFEVRKSNTRYLKAISSPQGVFVQEENVGLWHLQKAQAQLIANSQKISNIRVKGVVPLNHSIEKMDYLLISYKQGVYALNVDTMVPVNAALDSIKVMNLEYLQQSRFALCTHAHGIYIIDTKGNVLDIFDASYALGQDQVLFPFVDREGALWAGLFSGVSRLEYPASLNYLGKESGLKGLTQTICQYNRALYLGTTAGLYVLPLDAKPPHKNQVRQVTDPILPDGLPITLEVSNLIHVGDDLIIGGTEGIFNMHPDQSIHRLATSPANVLLRSKIDTDRIYVGNKYGLGSIYFKNGKWQDEGESVKLDHLVHQLYEQPDGKVWAAHLKASLVDPAFGTGRKPVVTTFDSSHGFVEALGHLELSEVNGQLVFGTGLGMMIFNNKTQQLGPYKAFGDWLSDGSTPVYNITPTRNNKVWITTQTNTGLLQQTTGGKWDLNTRAVQRAPTSDFWKIYEDHEGRFWLGATEGLFCYDPSFEQKVDKRYQTLIRKVFLNNDSLLLHGVFPNQPSGKAKTIPYNHNHLTFEYTATYYTAPEKLTYSHWLEGQETDWSGWHKKTGSEYTNLSEGNYTFNVRAKNVYGDISETARFTFTILPPWYRTVWAYLLYVTGVISLVYLLLRWSIDLSLKRQLKAQADKEAQQKAMLQVSLQAEEQERKRIAKDLHDDVQAALATAKLSLSIIQQELQKHGADGAGVAHTKAILTDTIQEVRNISHNLLPFTLEELGLVEALKELCGRIQKSTSIRVTCHFAGDDVSLGKEKQLALYRMVQELIGNTLKYASATEIQLQLNMEDGRAKLSYSDNGKGFDTKAVLENGTMGLGLRNLQSRVSVFNGIIEITSTIGKGTWVDIAL